MIILKQRGHMVDAQLPDGTKRTFFTKAELLRVVYIMERRIHPDHMTAQQFAQFRGGVEERIHIPDGYLAARFLPDVNAPYPHLQSFPKLSTFVEVTGPYRSYEECEIDLAICLREGLVGEVEYYRLLEEARGLFGFFENLLEFREFLGEEDDE